MVTNGIRFLGLWGRARWSNGAEKPQTQKSFKRELGPGSARVADLLASAGGKRLEQAEASSR